MYGKYIKEFKLTNKLLTTSVKKGIQQFKKRIKFTNDYIQ